MDASPRYLSAREAADRLGVTLATLYSYVSRGLVRSEAAGGPSRARRYHAEDVEVLRSRKVFRHDPARAAEGALSYGLPVLESAITMIRDGRLFYRGYDVMALAQACTVEQVAALIWLDRLEPGDLFGSAERRARPPDDRHRMPGGDQNPIALFQTMLARAAGDDLAAYYTTPEAVAVTGAHILDLLVAVTSGRPAGPSWARTLQLGWAPQQPEAATLLSAAMILCADHELNVSAFTARCVASAGSTPYAVVIAGLAALQGHRHGGNTEQVAQLLDDAEAGVLVALGSYLKRGAPIPGFGHPLYPDGDPRGRLLLNLVDAHFPAADVPAQGRALSDAVYELTGLQPTIDFALEVTARTLRLPDRAALILFALGRTIGWIGHATEQYATGQLIRPRARYNGPEERDLVLAGGDVVAATLS